jgi:hypothetical protein
MEKIFVLLRRCRRQLEIPSQIFAQKNSWIHGFILTAQALD